MKKIKTFITENVALIGLIVVFFIGILVSASFFTTENMTNLLRSASIMGLVSVGMTFVILCGSIDLSVSSVFSLCSYFFIAYSQQSILLAIIIPIFAGAAVGFVNGLIVDKMKIPAFVGTLATMLFVRGLVLLLTNEVTVRMGDLPTPLAFIGRGVFFGKLLSFPLVVFVLVIVIMSFILKKTPDWTGDVYCRRQCGCRQTDGCQCIQNHDHRTYAFGNDGRTRRDHICLTCGLGSAAGSGTGYELYAIAAVVIGGCTDDRRSRQDDRHTVWRADYGFVFKYFQHAKTIGPALGTGGGRSHIAHRGICTIGSVYLRNIKPR